MVERLQDKDLTGATFLDLDGTLISANSMHIFMKHLPRLLLKRHAFLGALSALWWTWMRTLKLTSHRKMKWHLTKTARRRLLDEDWESIAAALKQHINPRVFDYALSRRERGCKTYIATAALEEYALPLSRQLGFDGAVATRFSDLLSDYEELNGYAKHDAIESLLADNDLRLESFLTDHDDDLPTACAYPGLTIMVDPSDKSAHSFQMNGVTRYLLTKPQSASL